MHKPVKFTSHILRPLIDLHEEGKPIPWAEEIKKGLRGSKTAKEISGLAHILHMGKSPRYEVLVSLLKQLGFPETYTRVRVTIPKPKKNPPYVIKQKPKLITKWWKKPVEGEEPDDA